MEIEITWLTDSTTLYIIRNYRVESTFICYKYGNRNTLMRVKKEMLHVSSTIVVSQIAGQKCGMFYDMSLPYPGFT